MRKPQPPPPVQELVIGLTSTNPEGLLKRMIDVSVAGGRYLPWDELRRRKPPEGLTSEEWWLLVKLARNGMQRTIPLTGKGGQRLTYAIPDETARYRAGGQAHERAHRRP